MCQPFSIKWINLMERSSFDQKYKFSNKNTLCRSKVWKGMKVLQPNSITLGNRKLWQIFPTKQKFDTRAAFLDNPNCSIWSSLKIFGQCFQWASRLHNCQRNYPQIGLVSKVFTIKKSCPCIKFLFNWKNSPQFSIA